MMTFFQITNFFDVKDDPVLGFSPPTVVTVFHTHVWEGAIDYRFVCVLCVPDLADACQTAMESKNKNISCFHARSFQKLHPKIISKIVYSADLGIFVCLLPRFQGRDRGRLERGWDIV